MKICVANFSFWNGLTVTFDGEVIPCATDRNSLVRTAFYKAMEHFTKTNEEVLVLHYTYSGGYTLAASFGKVALGGNFKKAHGFKVHLAS